MDSLGQYVFTSLLKVLTSFTGDYYRTISESFRGIFMALVVLYIIGIGYAALMNALAEKTKAAVVSVFVVLFCYTLVFDTNLFSEWVYMPLRKASLGLTSLVLSPSGSGEIKDIFSAIDGSNGSLATYFSPLFESAGLDLYQKHPGRCALFFHSASHCV